MRKYLQLRLPKRASHCMQCNKELSSEAMSLLKEEENASFLRKDLCLECMQQAECEEPHWKVPERIKTLPSATRTSFDAKALERIEELLQSNPRDQEIVFLVLHLQRRKKICSIQENSEGTTFEVLATKEQFTVPLHTL